MEAIKLSSLSSDTPSSTDLFAQIAEDIYQKGFSINPNILSPDLCELLVSHAQSIQDEKFSAASIGRQQDTFLNNFIRKDKICWITGETEAGCAWLEWSKQLQSFLNRRLFLGLFSFESHFAHYQVGDFYKKHYDAFRGEANRVLSIVVYLNSQWQNDDGGELVLYQSDEDIEGIKVIPGLGTVVVFLSEEFPHEVLKAKRDRFSIAGWFRVNTSIANKIDPPA